MPRIRNVGGVSPLPFLYVPAVLNVVTTGNGTGTKNVLNWNRVLGFEFSIQSSVYGAITVAKVSLFSTWTWSTVSFYSYVSVEIDLFSCELGLGDIGFFITRYDILKLLRYE